MKTKLTFLTFAVFGWVVVHTSAMADPVWVGSWNCKSRNSGGTLKVTASSNGDYRFSNDSFTLTGYWQADGENAYHYLIPHVMEGRMKVKPSDNGFIAIGATETYDCPPRS